MKNKTHFPTIGEICDALRAYSGGNCDVSYDVAERTFLCLEYYPKAHYDDGGGLDSVDYEEYSSIIGYKTAYDIWVDWETRSNYHPEELGNPIPPLAPVPPLAVDYDDDLPF